MENPSEQISGEDHDLPTVGNGSGSPHGNPSENGDVVDDEPVPAPSNDFSVFGFVLIALLACYAVVGSLVLLLSAYSLMEGWTLYEGRPYWAAICWPVGAIGLLTPPIMKLDDVTEVKRTPPVTGRALAAYGAGTVGYLFGIALSHYPFGFAGAVATVAFTVLCAQYILER